MVADQLSLLEAFTPAAPRCRMCAKPARWLTTSQQYGMYCGGYSCTNRERICQHCSSPFNLNVNGAGTKYCSAPCKAAARHPAINSHTCAWCNQPRPGTRKGGRSNWPYICAPCLDPLKHVVDRLKAHHVPHQRARQLIDNPGCEVCGTDMLAKTRDPGRNKVIAALTVDHDHQCCPVDSVSCGRCIRGLICRHCNAAAGMLKDNPKYAMSLASYLELHERRPVGGHRG